MATEIILIRHGYTIRVNGDYVHAPLTALGRQQAEQTGKFLNDTQLPIGGFYTSPLRRANETADIIGTALGEKAEVVEDVRELEGLEVPALAVAEALSVLDVVEDYLDAQTGKPIRWPIEGRVSRALTDMADKHPDQRVVVVAHSGVISSVLAWMFTDQRLHWWLTTVGNCSLTRIRLGVEPVELLGVNEIAHLAQVGTTIQAPDRSVQAAKKVLRTVKPTAPH